MNLNELKQYLRENDIRPSKGKGQNFLIDKNILNKIVEKSEIGSDENILEVGPGFGVLTERIVRKAKRVLAVELDRKLYEYLQDKFEDQENLEIVNKDILKITDKEIEEKLGKNYRVIANLPYSITSKFIRVFLERENKPEEMIIMIQKEVGERMTARKPNMNMLALSTQYYSEAKMLFDVTRGCFFPEPKVDSVIIRLKLKHFSKLRSFGGKREKGNDDELFRFIKLGFVSKRKKLSNNLSKGYDKVKLGEVFASLGFDENVRAQELGMEEWESLFGALGNEVKAKKS
jgi:16S rRNA (adenine1518-N6/adenine1519-N6)-dimethyltransferase